MTVGPSVKFAGFIVSAEGMKPNPERLQAIKDFPQPKNITDMRSFMGLVTQLGPFVPDIAQLTSPLRNLLKKNVAWVWLPEHQTAFDKIRQLLTSDVVVKPFDSSLATELLTDASRLHGLGFALLQRDDNDQIRMIHCGSRHLNSAESRYSTIELECLAIRWAVQKCKYYLMGMSKPFKILTDHRPLGGIFDKDLSQVASKRLQKYREELAEYSFHIVWVPGKEHLISDALSRAPVFSAANHADAFALECEIPTTSL